MKVLVHPECRSDVIALADAVLSTSGMVRYAKESPAKEFLVVTECGLSDKLLLEVPEKTFYKACKLCQFMKMITLESTQRALERMQYPIELEESVRRGRGAQPAADARAECVKERAAKTQRAPSRSTWRPLRLCGPVL